MSNNVLWAGPRLLVPITVDALVVTDVNNATEFSVQPLQLGQYKHFGGIMPNLFVSTGFGGGTPTSKGVYLNWALPDAINQGTKNEGVTSVQYPYLPNRWMIIRFSADPNVSRQAWIVESDYMFPSGTIPNDGRPVASPYINADENGNAQISVLGQVYDFNGWTEGGANTPLFLTAVANSDPMFTAYAGNNSYTFSFVDRFSSTATTEMSYMVCGWYANVQYDILYNQPPVGQGGWQTEQDWLKLMTRLQWSVGAETIDNNPDLDNAMTAAANWLKANGITPPEGLTGTLCAQTLCHGLVFDVQWPGDNVEPPSNVPVFQPSEPQTVPYIAAGNTSEDCMAAFMQWQLNYNNADPDGDDADVQTMLEAFTYKMLPQPGGLIDTPDLMNAIHSAWFGHMPGGTKWVVQTQQNNNQTNAPATLSPQLATELTSLNTLQQAYDANCRQLSTMQIQLYADWIKWNLAPTYNGVKQALANDLAAVNAMIVQLQAELGVLNAANQALVAALGNSGLILKNNPANDFYMPNDPTFLVNNAKRTFKRGEDTIYSQDDTYLFVRFTGQFINSLMVNTASANVVVNGSQICPAFSITDQVPKEIPALLEEAYLLDTTFSTAIAQIATNQGNPPTNIINAIQQQQTLIWNSNPNSALDQRTLEEISGFNPGDTLFHVPSKIGVWQWQQPWNPLFLEWQVEFYQAADLSLWQFDGSDYNWITTNPVPVNNPNPQVLSGRSILTPKEAVTLQAQLMDFINSYPAGKLPPGYIPLQDVLNGVGDWDVLSQTLKGFGEQLLQWNIQQFGYTPTDQTYNVPISYNPENAGQPQVVGHGMPVAINNTPFYPVRAGFVQILQLWIVDDYGQVYNINPNTGGQLQPRDCIPGIGFEPPGYSINEQQAAYFQLPPRVVQPSRLNFEFVSATGDSTPSGQDLDTTPVCGWILPNHIDDSVAVYDNTGQILGELALQGPTGGQHAQWEPAPFTGVDAANIPNLHLRGFVQGLLGTTSSNEGIPWSGPALTNFMKTVDETLWSVDPLGERNTNNLSILIGRPIALVRASIELELYGNPATNLTFAETGQNNNGGIADYVFQVQIGNIDLMQDGVMGYFNADNYSQFNSVHYGEVTSPANPPYVVNNFTPLQFEASSPTYMTILVDPRGDIHCSTGILPVLETELPDMYTSDAMNNMLLEFKTGPLITDTQTWTMPLPAGAGLKWSWLQPVLNDGQTAWQEITKVVKQTDVIQLPVNSPTIIEGKLKLAGALGSQPVVYFLQVNGYDAPYNVPTGTTVQLSWAAQGAAATLTVDSNDPINVPLNSAGYSFAVNASHMLTLTVTGAGGATTPPAKISITATS